jgi:oligopeptide/dipeptide ABC transporter ATP-binding protein
MVNGNNNNQVLLEARDLKKHFPVTKGLVLMKVAGWLKAVDGVSFQIRRGQTLGIVGESGCGKTTTAKMVLMMEKPTSGGIFFQGKDLAKLSTAERKEYRASVQAVFQDPWSSLNPRLHVGSIIAEPIIVNRNVSKGELKERVEKLLVDVGLNPYQAGLYPHEFSGGQRQRIAIARALALNPDVIILDEPVSALDVSIRAQIMNLLKDLQGQYNLSYLLIAHNLATVRYMCQQVAVMYLGRIVEEAPSKELFTNPLHPYTKALISAALPSHPDIQRNEIVLTGEVPSPVNPPSGCHFHPRCSYVMDHCSQVEPVLQEVGSGHWVSCHLYPSHSP